MSGSYEKGKQIIEGKTKVIYEIVGKDDVCLVESKDRITANTGMEGEKQHKLKGKAAVSTSTTCQIFTMLNDAGIGTHYVSQVDDIHFVVQRCEMIPIEFVTRRVATGSFLRRNPGVKEGLRFCPPKLEFFFKDDAQGDPQWSREQIIESKWCFNGRKIGSTELDMMSKATVCIFEILEKAWQSVDCSLIDMKIEFGVNKKGEIVLADVIDSDSWRLWPSGDKRLMKDKQVYRNLKDVTDEGLAAVIKNFQWVADKIKEILSPIQSRVAVFMGSPTDMDYCTKIKKILNDLGITCDLRISSAHKSTRETLDILAEYEGGNVPTVFIAVAGRSNGLGPVLSGNATWPVINCPPISSDWGDKDIWSSLRLPSGLSCPTVTSPEAAALHAAEILAMREHMVWCKLRAMMLNNAIKLMHADARLQDTMQ